MKLFYALSKGGSTAQSLQILGRFEVANVNGSSVVRGLDDAVYVLWEDLVGRASAIAGVAGGRRSAGTEGSVIHLLIIK